jgi:hypothetical protein
MTCGRHPQPIGGHIKFVGGLYRAAIEDTAAAQNIHNPVIVGAIRIGHALDPFAKNGFQYPAIFQHFIGGNGGIALLQEGMVQTVAGDFKQIVLIKLQTLLGRHAATNGLGEGVTGQISAAIDIEGAFDAVLSQNFGKPLVLLNTVIVAQGQRFGFAAWEEKMLCDHQNSSL